MRRYSVQIGGIRTRESPYLDTSHAVILDSGHTLSQPPMLNQSCFNQKCFKIIVSKTPKLQKRYAAKYKRLQVAFCKVAGKEVYVTCHSIA